MIRTKAPMQILSQVLKHLREHTDITLLEPGSTARMLVEAITSEIAAMFMMTDAAMSNAFPSTAQGPYLDLIGELVGVTRVIQEAPIVQASDKNIRFYVLTGTLGSYIADPMDPTKVLVPAGTTIYTQDTTTVFVVDNDHSGPATATELYVSARASNVGPGTSVGPGTLVRNSLSNSVLTENLESISTATTIESDEQLRARIFAATRVSEGNNTLAVRYAALLTPGIADVILNEFSSGSGSFDVILIPEGNRVPTGSMREAIDRISSVIPFGITFKVREPRYISFSIDLELSMPYAEETAKDSIRERVSGTIQRYIGDIRPSNMLVINKLRQLIMSVSDKILDIYIRSIRINGSPQINNVNFMLPSDAVFIPDPDETDPILVR